jgi:hypothetical protein
MEFKMKPLVKRRLIISVNGQLNIVRRVCTDDINVTAIKLAVNYHYCLPRVDCLKSVAQGLPLREVAYDLN